MTASQNGKSPTNRPLLVLLRGNRSQHMPRRKQTLFEPGSERGPARNHGISTLPNMAEGGVATMQRWSGEWTGDQLIRVEPPGGDICMDQTGSPCPKFAEARARQALAEHQLTEFSHRLVNMLQLLAIRVERQQRLQDVPARRDELERLVASIHASGRLHRYLLPPRNQSHVDLGLLLGNVATAIEGVTGLICDVEAESVSVPGQVAMHLAAAVNELAWNAHKHAYGGAEGGVLRIVCRRDGDVVLRLSVTDRGGGLPADFDPRLSEGLGLMIVCAITRRFSGTLQAESDRGARFTMLLNIQMFEGGAP